MVLKFNTYICPHINNNKMKETIKFTDIIEQLNESILNIQFDLQQDWNEEKELMFIQLQQLLIAKANLELILQTGGQIFSSSISK